MFTTMKAVAPQELPVATRGRTGSDVRETEEYKALASMPVHAHDSEQEKRTGFFAVECGSEDKAKKMQAKVNVFARAGAGTFKTRLLKGSTTLYIKRIAEEYVPQRGKDSEG